MTDIYLSQFFKHTRNKTSTICGQECQSSEMSDKRKQNINMKKGNLKDQNIYCMYCVFYTYNFLLTAYSRPWVLTIVPILLKKGWVWLSIVYHLSLVDYFWPYSSRCFSKLIWTGFGFLNVYLIISYLKY